MYSLIAEQVIASGIPKPKSYSLVQNSQKSTPHSKIRHTFENIPRFVSVKKLR